MVQNSTFDEMDSDAKGFDDLVEEMRETADALRKTVDSVEARRDGVVVLGHNYTLEYTFSASQDEASDAEPWKFRKVPYEEKVDDLVRRWRHTGEPLRDEKILRRDDLTLTDWRDVVRIVPALMESGETYATMMADRPETREGLSIILANMKRLRACVDEVLAGTVDARPSAAEDPDLKEGLAKIVEGARQLSKTIPATRLSVGAAHQEGRTIPSAVGGTWPSPATTGANGPTGTFSAGMPLSAKRASSSTSLFRFPLSSSRARPSPSPRISKSSRGGRPFGSSPSTPTGFSFGRAASSSTAAEPSTPVGFSFGNASFSAAAETSMPTSFSFGNASSSASQPMGFTFGNTSSSSTPATFTFGNTPPST